MNLLIALTPVNLDNTASYPGTDEGTPLYPNRPNSAHRFTTQTQRAPMATLSIQIPGGENIDFQISSKSTRIGRDDSCDLVISNSYISALHATLHQSDEGTFLIEDQDSTHGVLVNGQRVAAEKLTDGDTITLGQLDLILHLNDTQRPATTSAPTKITSAQIPAAPPRQASPLQPPGAFPPKPTPLQPPSLSLAAAPTLMRRTSAQTPAAAPIQRPSQATTQPLPDHTTKPVPMRPVPNQKKDPQWQPNNTPTWPTSKQPLKPGSPAQTPLPTQKNEAGPRSLNTAPPSTEQQSAEAQIHQLQQKIAELEQEEHEKRNLYLDSLEDMRGHIAELGQEKRKLREDVESLRDRYNAVQARVDDEDDAFLPVMFEVVKRVDLLESMIQNLESIATTPDETLTQLRTLRASFQDLFERHNIRAESIAPGTQLNLGIRRRIRIVDDAGNGTEPSPVTETTKSQPPAQSQVKATVRPGIVYTPKDGNEVLLRKVEVSIEDL